MRASISFRERKWRERFFGATGGFSFLELTVAVAITILLASTVLLNYRSVYASEALARSANAVIAEVRDAQNRALAPAQGDLAGGYGLYFDISSMPTRYLLFADGKNGNQINQRYDGGIPTDTTCPSGSECVKVFTLSGGSRWTKFMTDRFAGSQQHVSTLFCPPYALGLFYGNTSGSNTLCQGNGATMIQSATLTMTAGKDTRSVVLYASGAADLQ